MGAEIINAYYLYLVIIYVHSVYVDRLYQEVVADAAEESMKAAVECVKASPHYATSGEVRVATFVKKFNVFIFFI